MPENKDINDDTVEPGSKKTGPEAEAPAPVIEGEIITPNQLDTLLQSGNDVCRRVASNGKTPPEILHYLAENAEPQIRGDVAANEKAAHATDVLLSDDPEDEVRMELARKIARIIPNLGPEAASQIRERSIELLEKLADDQLPRVRQILSEELKDSLDAPKWAIKKLARDIESTVAGPVLEYSPLLGDDDLREIVAAGVVGEALVAVAKRRHISEDLADAIASTLEIPAVAALVTNTNADIREKTLIAIVEQAKKAEELHEPLTSRPNLSLRIMKRIAGFVASALVRNMVERADIDEGAAGDLIARTRMRIKTDTVDVDEEENYQEKAVDFLNRGMITDEFIVNCAEKRQSQLLFHCLAVKVDMKPTTVENVIRSKNGRAITALVWSAGLKMRTALSIQTKVAMVPPAKMVQAKGGTDFPFDEPTMQQELLFFKE
jgi:Uncharacterised protein conserved in bacteria (DUF2336)